MKINYNIKDFLSSLIFYLAILVFIIGFNFTDSPPPFGWYQQFMPNIGGRQISDIFFLDSLTGWAVTNNPNQDSAYVLKTTNSGDNWFILYRKLIGAGYSGYFRVYFLNQNTGYTCGVPGFYKSTDGGLSWVLIRTTDTYLDMSVLNVDTQWLVSSNLLTGGVFRTTNGGVNWDRQFSGGTQNPNTIYMYNARIGFISNNSALPNIYKTTNSGMNWDMVLSGENFDDMHFIDSLLGWKCWANYYAGDSSVKRTTDGGLNWIKQQLPHGGIILTSQIFKFSFINRDTIWGTGGQVFYGGGRFRGILYRTTNGGNNWLFQIPDTSYGIPGYGSIQFVNKNIGWAYNNAIGIHTTTGGNDTFYTLIKQISSKVPDKFMLGQNYPNPFNPSTNIKYQIINKSYVKLTVYDIMGKEVKVILNQKQSAGKYEVKFDGSGLSTGVYLYKIEINYGKEVYTQTKKMLLIK